MAGGGAESLVSKPDPSLSGRYLKSCTEQEGKHLCMFLTSLKITNPASEAVQLKVCTVPRGANIYSWRCRLMV